LRGPQNAWPTGLRGLAGQAARHATCVARPPAARNMMVVYQTIAAAVSRCIVARCLPREVANNVRKVAQLNRPIFQSNLFKSSPNAVVSLTGATASRFPSSCQSTHSQPAFVQRKTEKLGVKFVWAPLISLPILNIACPNFFCS